MLPLLVLSSTATFEEATEVATCEGGHDNNWQSQNDRPEPDLGVALVITSTH